MEGEDLLLNFTLQTCSNFTFVVDDNFNETLCLTEVTSQVHLPPFSFWITVIIAVCISICIIITVLGNILVLAAFVLDRQIRQPSNYFIFSLALSDLFIGLISMPFFAVYVLAGIWESSPIACDLWLATDHTVCLVSIYTVLLITIDRYCSVKIPTKYRNWRTKNKVICMVTITWIIPTLVFFISIMGWEHFIGYRDLEPGVCAVQFLKDPVFNTSLIFGYFYITLVVLFVLYSQIYKIAINMAKRAEEKRKTLQTLVVLGKDNEFIKAKTLSTAFEQGKEASQNVSTTKSNTSSSVENVPNFKALYNLEKSNSDQFERSSSSSFDSEEEQLENIPKLKYNIKKQADFKAISPKTTLSIKMPNKNETSNVVTSVFYSHLPKKVLDNQLLEQSAHQTKNEKKEPLKLESIIQNYPFQEGNNNLYKAMNSLSITNISLETLPDSQKELKIPEKNSVSDNESFESQVKVQVNKGEKVEKFQSNSDNVSSFGSSFPMPATENNQSLFNKTSDQNNAQKPLKTREVHKHHLSRTKRTKSKPENRARKALRTISFILGAFVICWTPYHIAALIEGFCKNCVNHHFFYFTYFLCYANSPINPFCYAMANQHYKRVFFRILKGDFSRH